MNQSSPGGESFPPERYRQDPADLAAFDPERLYRIANTVMPFGRHTGMRLIDLPEAYVLWFKQNGFPEGELGCLLAELAEIKTNGLEFLFEPLKKQ
jgi:uncharacterized protein (DUF3820 family)